MTWNVITAGPCAGKTSVIRELSRRGYNTAPEAARIFIDQKVSEGYDEDEIREEFNIVKHCEDIDDEIEHRQDPDETTFFDRSLADNIAYRRNFNMSVPPALLSVPRNRYDNVFLLERIGFEEDYARNETEEDAEEIHQLITEAYKELGYELVDVPLMPVDERADFILEKI